MKKKSIAVGVYKDPTIQQFLSEGVLESKEILSIIAEEVVLDEAEADSLRSNWWGRELRKVTDPTAKLKRAEELLALLKQAIDQEDIGIILPDTAKKSQEVQNAYLLAARAHYAKYTEGGKLPPNSTVAKAKMALASAETPQEKVEILGTVANANGGDGDAVETTLDQIAPELKGDPKVVAAVQDAANDGESSSGAIDLVTELMSDVLAEKAAENLVDPIMEKIKTVTTTVAAGGTVAAAGTGGTSLLATLAAGAFRILGTAAINKIADVAIKKMIKETLVKLFKLLPQVENLDQQMMEIVGNDLWKQIEAAVKAGTQEAAKKLIADNWELILKQLMLAAAEGKLGEGVRGSLKELVDYDIHKVQVGAMFASWFLPEEAILELGKEEIANHHQEGKKEEEAEAEPETPGGLDTSAAEAKYGAALSASFEGDEYDLIIKFLALLMSNELIRESLRDALKELGLGGGAIKKAIQAGQKTGTFSQDDIKTLSTILKDPEKSKKFIQAVKGAPEGEPEPETGTDEEAPISPEEANDILDQSGVEKFAAAYEDFKKRFMEVITLKEQSDIFNALWIETKTLAGLLEKQVMAAYNRKSAPNASGGVGVSDIERDKQTRPEMNEASADVVDQVMQQRDADRERSGMDQIAPEQPEQEKSPEPSGPSDEDVATQEEHVKRVVTAAGTMQRHMDNIGVALKILDREVKGNLGVANIEALQKFGDGNPKRLLYKFLALTIKDINTSTQHLDQFESFRAQIAQKSINEYDTAEEGEGESREEKINRVEEMYNEVLQRGRVIIQTRQRVQSTATPTPDATTQDTEGEADVLPEEAGRQGAGAVGGPSRDSNNTRSTQMVLSVREQAKALYEVMAKVKELFPTANPLKTEESMDDAIKAFENAIKNLDEIIAQINAWTGKTNISPELIAEYKNKLLSIKKVLMKTFGVEDVKGTLGIRDGSETASYNDNGQQEAEAGNLSTDPGELKPIDLNNPVPTEVTESEDFSIQSETNLEKFLTTTTYLHTPAVKSVLNKFEEKDAATIWKFVAYYLAYSAPDKKMNENNVVFAAMNKSKAVQANLLGQFDRNNLVGLMRRLKEVDPGFIDKVAAVIRSKTAVFMELMDVVGDEMVKWDIFGPWKQAQRLAKIRDMDLSAKEDDEGGDLDGLDQFISDEITTLASEMEKENEDITDQEVEKEMSDNIDDIVDNIGQELRREIDPDGEIPPDKIKTLVRDEIQKISSSEDFWDNTFDDGDLQGSELETLQKFLGIVDKLKTSLKEIVGPHPRDKGKREIYKALGINDKIFKQAMSELGDDTERRLIKRIIRFKTNAVLKVINPDAAGEEQPEKDEGDIPKEGDIYVLPADKMAEWAGITYSPPSSWEQGAEIIHIWRDEEKGVELDIQSLADRQKVGVPLKLFFDSGWVKKGEADWEPSAEIREAANDILTAKDEKEFRQKYFKMAEMAEQEDLYDNISISAISSADDVKERYDTYMRISMPKVLERGKNVFLTTTEGVLFAFGLGKEIQKQLQELLWSFYEDKEEPEKDEGDFVEVLREEWAKLAEIAERIDDAYGDWDGAVNNDIINDIIDANEFVTGGEGAEIIISDTLLKDISNFYSAVQRAPTKENDKAKYGGPKEMSPQMNEDFEIIRSAAKKLKAAGLPYPAKTDIIPWETTIADLGGIGAPGMVAVGVDSLAKKSIEDSEEKYGAEYVNLFLGWTNEGTDGKPWPVIWKGNQAISGVKMAYLTLTDEAKKSTYEPVQEGKVTATPDLKETFQRWKRIVNG